MILKLRLLILVNWQERGKWLFLRFLDSRVKQASVLQPISIRHTDNRPFTRVSNYLSEGYVPAAALFRRKTADVVISWQMRIGVFYGLFKRFCHARQPPIHIIHDFHIDLTETRFSYRVRKAFLKLAIRGIDYFCCTSTEEEAIYGRMFGIPRDRIVFMPLAPPLFNREGSIGPPKDYVFAYGNSDRDFETLIRAVDGLDIPTVILSQKYRPRRTLPENVTLIGNRISEKELLQWIVSSRMVVIPLKDYRISAGQLSLLETMSLGRPVVVTRNMATREYAIHHQTAMFHEAKDSMELASHIRYLWKNKEAAEEIGKRAKLACPKITDKRQSVFTDLLERCAAEIEKKCRNGETGQPKWL